MPKSPYTVKVSLNVEFSFESCNFMEVLLGFMRFWQELKVLVNLLKYNEMYGTPPTS